MQDQLSRYIRQLLFEHSTLSLPGLGSFVAAPSPALIDPVQGKVTAPALKISFNPNLVVDDGLLLEQISQQQGTTINEAQSWLQVEIDTISKALQQRQIVELAGVGRFYMDFQGTLKFVAESTNYNTAAYGLQPVVAQPVIRRPVERTPPPVASTAPAETAKKTAPAAKQTVPSLWWKNPLLWALLAVLLFVGILATVLYDTSSPSAQPSVEVPQDRLNTSPSRDQALTETGEDESPVTTSPDTSLPSESGAETVIPPATPPSDTEAPTLSPNEHTAVISVGFYGNSANAERMVTKLANWGYSPFTEEKSKGTRVGVNIRYRTEAERDELLRDVQKTTGSKSAFILYQDGVLMKR